jgi:hypothetical protein
LESFSVQDVCWSYLFSVPVGPCYGKHKCIGTEGVTFLFYVLYACCC